MTVTGATNFTITAPGVSVSTYGQTNNIITVTNSGHGLAVGNSVYLDFATGGASNGIYLVTTVPTNSAFTVAAPDSVTRTGNCFFPKLSAAGYQQVKTNITVSTVGAHGLVPGDEVCIHFTSGSATNGVYQVASVPDATHFVVVSTTSVNQTHNNLSVYPLQLTPLNRSGSVVVQFSTWILNATDTGATAALDQTPLNSPTVFNFFFPDYKFPGTLASAGITTPEFQLTSDSSVALQMNYLEGGALGTNSNVGGLSSFNSGNGAIVMDLNPWMTTNYTANAGIPALVSSLNTLLAAGQLSTNATSAIASYVANTTNFAYSSPPTSAQMASRVRAVVHLILTSPDYTIQK